jgi:hypothetical protein
MMRNRDYGTVTRGSHGHKVISDRNRDSNIRGIHIWIVECSRDRLFAKCLNLCAKCLNLWDEFQMSFSIDLMWYIDIHGSK